MCKTPEELRTAVAVVGRVMEDLGLELAPDKTKEVDFHVENFNFLGFTFYHIRNDRGGREYFYVRPTKDKEDAFKAKMRDTIRKHYSKSNDEWAAYLNPIIRGTFNYWLIPQKALMKVDAAWKEKGGRRATKARFPKTLLSRMDGYIRQRLRVNFANRGKAHAKRVSGFIHHVKYGNAFFLQEMKLVSGRYLLAQILFPELTADKFLSMISDHDKKKRAKRNQFFQFAYSK